MKKGTIMLIVTGLVFFGAFFFKEKAIEGNISSQDGESMNEISNDVILASSQVAKGNLLISQVILSRPGFIVALELKDGVPGEILGASSFLGVGNYENINVSLKDNTLTRGKIRLLLYADNGNKRFSKEKDAPVLSVAGVPVSVDIELR